MYVIGLKCPLLEDEAFVCILLVEQQLIFFTPICYVHNSHRVSVSYRLHWCSFRFIWQIASLKCIKFIDLSLILCVPDSQLLQKMQHCHHSSCSSIYVLSLLLFWTCLSLSPYYLCRRILFILFCNLDEVMVGKLEVVQRKHQLQISGCFFFIFCFFTNCKNFSCWIFLHWSSSGFTIFIDADIWRHWATGFWSWNFQILPVFSRAQGEQVLK